MHPENSSFGNNYGKPKLIQIIITDSNLDVTTELCWCCGTAATPEGQHSYLVLDSVLNGQPVQLMQAVMAGHEIVLEPGERSWLHCFALAAEPECCWLEHHTALSCSSPAGQYETVSQCHREFCRQ